MLKVRTRVFTQKVRTRVIINVEGKNKSEYQCRR